jgi:hypothetical protein
MLNRGYLIEDKGTEGRLWAGFVSENIPAAGVSEHVHRHTYKHITNIVSHRQTHQYITNTYKQPRNTHTSQTKPYIYTET